MFAEVSVLNKSVQNSIILQLELNKNFKKNISGLIVQCSQWLTGCMSDVCPNVSSKSWVVSRVKPSGMLLVLASRCDWVVHMIQKPSLKQCYKH